MMTFDANVAGATVMNSTVASAVSTYTATRSASIKSGNTGRLTTQALYSMPDPDIDPSQEFDVTPEDLDGDGDDGTVV
jgi:hypothetical protein